MLFHEIILEDILELTKVEKAMLNLEMWNQT